MNLPDSETSQGSQDLKLTGLEFLIPSEKQAIFNTGNFLLQVATSERATVLSCSATYPVIEAFDQINNCPARNNTVSITLTHNSGNDTAKKTDAQVTCTDLFAPESKITVTARRLVLSLADIRMVNPMIANILVLCDADSTLPGDRDVIDADPATIFEIFGNLVAAYYAHTEQLDVNAYIGRMNAGRILQRLGLDKHIRNMVATVRDDTRLDKSLTLENDLGVEISLALIAPQASIAIEPGAIVTIKTKTQGIYTIQMGGIDYGKQFNIKKECRVIVTYPDGFVRMVRTTTDWEELQQKMFSK